MDNLTHTLTGVLLARAGLDKLSPRATLIAILAANMPDADAVSALGGATVYFTYHRWATHAVLFSPLVAMLPVVAVALLFRQRLPWFRAWLLSLACVASHLVLDFTNPYGIRLLLPFSDAWPALGITHVIDVWIWAMLLAGVVWPLLSRLVGSEIGASNSSGRGVAITVLCLLAFYDTSRYFLQQEALETLESRVYDGAGPKRTVVFPQNVSPMRWDGWVETERAWLKVDVDLTTEFDPRPVARYWKAEPNRAFEIARTAPIFQVFSGFVQTPLWRISPAEEPTGARKVELIDLRFGRNGGLGFSTTAIVDADGKLIRSAFSY